MSSTLPLTHNLPALPYGLDALAPHISRETLDYHYGKHHRAYVEKLNALVHGTRFADASLEELIQQSSGALFNNAAQVWNHNFYWQCLHPLDTEPVPAALAHAITQAFGGLEAFATQFKASALTKFGSGWTWLVREQNGALAIVNSDDADNPLRHGQRPLLVCDVWEHAYYIDYRNARAQYLDAFWQLIDWRFVARNFDGDQCRAQ